MRIAIITEEQKRLLIGKEFTPDNYFNPVMDIDNNWVISEEEIVHCDVEGFEWLKTLPLTIYKAPEYKLW